MNQPQIQHRPSVANGAKSCPGDRDLGNRLDNFKNDHLNYSSFKPGSSTNTSIEGAQSRHQHVIDTKTFHNCQGGSSEVLGGKLEASAEVESRDGGPGPLSQQLIYLTACLVGQLVEVQVKNGSIYSGIFHTANAEKDYGIVLKVVRLVKDGPSRKNDDAVKDSARRPVKTLIISAKDLVQIIAKDVAVSGDLLQNGKARENRAEIVMDSFLSQGRHGEVERELKPWTPDKDDPKDLGLDSTFQNTWNRNWDQFEINKTLFGVESTFDEDLYTTKLERGPQTREREREALRIAREIEGQSTKNFHVAEERGEAFEYEGIDEESRFSSVLRSSGDVCEEDEDGNFTMHNDETFRDSLNFTDAPGSLQSEPSLTNVWEGTVSSSSTMDIVASCDSSSTSQKENMEHVAVGDPSKHVKVVGLTSPLASPSVGDTTSIQALNLDPGCPQVTEDVYREFNEFKQQENAKRGKKLREDQVNELKSFSESLKDFTVRQHGVALVGGTHKQESVYAHPASTLPVPTTSSTSTLLGGSTSVMQIQCTSCSSTGEPTRVAISDVDTVSVLSQVERPSTSGMHSSLLQNFVEVAPVSPMNSASATTPSSPSSSSGVSTSADSMKKSALNPNAKEFKLNPNAKSFTPNFTLRPPSPVVQGPVYVPGVMPSVAPIQSMTVGANVNPSLQAGGQSVAKYTPYNPVAVAAVSCANLYVPSPGTYMPGVSGATVSPVLGAGQSAIKVTPQLQPPAAGHSYGSQQPIRYTSQTPPVQPTSTYVHPSGPLYSQQMMFAPPGPVVYIQPYPQGPPVPAPQVASQQLQRKHRGAGVEGVQLCVAPPFIAGQQHFLSGQQHFVPQVQVPQLSNPVQPTPGVLGSTTMSPIQPPPQGVIGGMVTPAHQPSTGSLSGTNVMRMGGKIVGLNFQQ